MKSWTLTAMILVAAAAAACDGTSPTEQPPPEGVAAKWEATHVRGAALPDVLYRFDPDVVDGEIVSVHIILDSARLVIHDDGRYEHRIWASHWVGEPGGPPQERTLRFHHGDHGFWSDEDGALRFESNYLQNHRMTGALGASGALEMQHGFTHGDPPVSIRYGH